MTIFEGQPDLLYDFRAGKRAALERIELGEPLPAAGVADAEWYLDRAAQTN